MKVLVSLHVMARIEGIWVSFSSRRIKIFSEVSRF